MVLLRYNNIFHARILLSFFKEAGEKIAIIHAPSWQKATSVMFSCLIPVSFRNQSNQYTSVRMTWKSSLSFPHPVFLSHWGCWTINNSTNWPLVPTLTLLQWSLTSMDISCPPSGPSNIIFLCTEQKVRYYVPVNKKSDVMFLWPESQM